MVGIFPQAQQSVGGLFERINQAAQTPSFGLGIGLLAGSPQAGFQNAQQAIRTQQAGQRSSQAADPQAVREAQFLFPGDVERQRAFVEKRTTGQAGGVQSTFIGADGELNLVMRDGSVRQTGKKARNNLQISDVGGVPTAIDRITGEARQVATPEQVGGNAATITSIKAFGELADQAAADLPEAAAKAGVFSSTIKDLLPGGELRKGFEAAYGFKRPDFTVLEGSERKDAQAAVGRLVNSQTLEALKFFKGSISDADIALAEGAMTTLSNPSISDKEADKALKQLHDVITRNEKLLRDRASKSPAGAPQATPINLQELSDEEIAARIEELSGR